MRRSPSPWSPAWWPRRRRRSAAGARRRPSSSRRSSMRLEWFGQSAFRLDDGETTIIIDPFDDLSPLTQGRGMRWDYPPIAGVEADLVLVTHEHLDHN